MSSMIVIETMEGPRGTNQLYKYLEDCLKKTDLTKAFAVTRIQLSPTSFEPNEHAGKMLESVKRTDRPTGEDPPAKRPKH